MRIYNRVPWLRVYVYVLTSFILQLSKNLTSAMMLAIGHDTWPQQMEIFNISMLPPIRVYIILVCLCLHVCVCVCAGTGAVHLF